ncbi:ATPase [Candidatus Peregrinibacteria bacterium RIFOXYB2_FULL_32_7]|nr:MAG: ATPase [Candidatus Peregrinibacteria bacterium RIFOXYB2_FULL_32_7]
MKFVARDNEIKVLNKKLRENNSNFFVIYGKRRVGKTELVKQFIKDKNAIYYLADKRSSFEQLRDLSKVFSETFNDKLLLKRGFTEWLDVFEYLKEKKLKNFIFVIDEYPYLVEIDKSMSSVFQKAWDEYLKDTGIFLIILGSSMSIMESETLNYKSPLYGRRTGQILLKNMSFMESWKFFPKMKFESFLKIYTVTGGMPAYIMQFDDKLTFEQNLKEKIFNKSSFLHNEIEFILKEEFREPKNYLSILRAIAFSKTKFSEIVSETNLEKNILSKYLSVLEKLQIIEKETPILEINPLKSKRGIYKISDNFFKFWFKYILPNRSELELDNYQNVIKKINQDFNLLESQVYERVCHEIILNFQKKLFEFEKIGRYWDSKIEIDLIAFNSSSKQVLFGEAKWSNQKVDSSVFFNLKEKAKSIKWNNDKRKEYFALFSKTGFDKKLIELSKKENLTLVCGSKIGLTLG